MQALLFPDVLPVGVKAVGELDSGAASPTATLMPTFSAECVPGDDALVKDVVGTTF